MARLNSRYSRGRHGDTRRQFALAYARRDTLVCSPESSFIRSYPSFIQSLIHLNHETTSRRGEYEARR